MTGTHIATLTGHSEEILDVCFDSAGQRIATCSVDGKWSDWDCCKNCNSSIKQLVLLVLHWAYLDGTGVSWLKTIDQAKFVAL